MMSNKFWKTFKTRRIEQGRYLNSRPTDRSSSNHSCRGTASILASCSLSLQLQNGYAYKVTNCMHFAIMLFSNVCLSICCWIHAELFLCCYTQSVHHNWWLKPMCTILYEIRQQNCVTYEWRNIHARLIESPNLSKAVEQTTFSLTVNAFLKASCAPIKCTFGLYMALHIVHMQQILN
jgi:hypothetical protein